MVGGSSGGASAGMLALLYAGALLLMPTALAAQAAPSGSDTSRAAHDTSGGKASSDTVPRVAFGAFIDTYYAYNVDRPDEFDRFYTTQPARWDEFNINLAFLSATLTGPRYRGRLAVQYGTSVQSNYFGEPRLGEVSGSSVAEFIQEATIGYELGKTVWIDGGIFFAHTGYEGWISRDNLTYTRSLVADYSPYYEAGVKLTWTPSSRVAMQFLILNGWQDISNYNSPQAGGFRVDYTPSSVLTLSYDNFIGNMAPDTARAQIRFYNDFIAQLNPQGPWQWAAVFDIGAQTHSASNGGSAGWLGATLIGKYHFSPVVAVVGRIEDYADPSQVIVKTGLPTPFVTSAASLGVDVSPAKQRFLWRTEVRGYVSDGAVWPTHQPGVYDRTDLFAVTSMALTL